VESISDTKIKHFPSTVIDENMLAIIIAIKEAKTKFFPTFKK
jgi:Pyruvate/2-oxoacid:ferredoxin oxidoreductase gamma subunit